MRIVIFLTALFPLVSHADTNPLPPLTCEGRGPEWKLDILSDDLARFQFAGRDTQFDIPQKSRAEGEGGPRNWPQAFTLVARNDTAILVLNEESCTLENDRFPLSLHVLTQRGTTPILLTGCCAVAE